MRRELLFAHPRGQKQDLQFEIERPILLVGFIGQIGEGLRIALGTSRLWRTELRQRLG